MIKEVLQILITIFLAILCYDTINIYFNQLDSKKEKEVLIIRREIGGTKKLFNKTIPYETSYFAFWPIVLGFSSAFSFIFYRYLLPAKYARFRKEVIKFSSSGKDDIVKEINNKNNRGSTCNLKKKDETKSHNVNQSKANIKNEVGSAKNCDINNDNLPQEVKSVSYISNHNNGLPSQEEKEAFIGIAEKNPLLALTPNLLHADMLPLSSALNILSNDSLSLSGSSLIQLECSHSKNLCDLISEKRNISKIGLPIHRSLYTDENEVGKQVTSKNFFESGGDLLAVRKNRLLVDKETSLKSDSTIDEMSILANQDQLMELLSIYNNNVKYQQKHISDKANYAQLLTYSDNDIKNIEKRLEAIEIGLKKSEDRTKGWCRRINVAETELVDLHEQMYTLFSKIEEEKKPNYIIVSQFHKKHKESKESNIISDADETAAEHNEVTSHEEKKSANNIYYFHENDVDQPSKDKKAKHKEVSKKTFGKIGLCGESSLVLNEIKKKSIALETYIANESEAVISTYTPRKMPILSVPPHVLPPHKRSTFASTDSKCDIVKRKKFRTIPVPDDSAWRTKVR